MTRRSDNRALRTSVPRDQLPAFEPVPRQCNRHDGWTPARQLAFVEALADTGSVAAAARAVNMSPEGAYYLRRQPGADSFRAAWEAALDCGVHMLEDKVMERAIHGVEVPVLSCGKEFGTRRVYNERTAMLILQARLPGKYGMQRARAMNGLDKQVLARKKREWRREWETEEAHKRKLAEIAARDEDDDEEKVREEIDAFLDNMRERHLESMSPRTRAAHDEYERLAAEDKANGYNYWEDPEHPNYVDYTKGGAGEEDPLPLPPPGGSEAGEAPERSAPSKPRVRSLKDEGW